MPHPLNQTNIRPADLIPEPKIQPVIVFEFGVVDDNLYR